MKTNRQINACKFIIICLFTGFFLTACEDKETPFSLDITTLSVKVDEVGLIRASGAGELSVSATVPQLVSITVDGSVIRVKGVLEGKTVLTVKNGDGKTLSCSVTVLKSEDETHFLDAASPRIEGWKDEPLYPERETGLLVSIEREKNALGLEDKKATTYNMSFLERDEYIRFGAVGSFSQPGILNDGWVVLQEKGMTEQYLICKNAYVLKVENGKTWLKLQFADHRDIRIVAELP